MTLPEFPGFDGLLARLLGGVKTDLVGQELREVAGDLRARGQTPGQGFLRSCADALGLHAPDVFLIAGVRVPEEELPLDDHAGGDLPSLVSRALQLPISGREQLFDRACALPQEPRIHPPRQPRLYEQYPTGFGGLLVQMLALRNLTWSTSARVLYLMSGVYLSAATIGAVGRGRKELDSEPLAGLAVVLGIPAPVLASLTGLPVEEVSLKPSVKTAGVAELLWEARRLTAHQVLQLGEVALDIRWQTMSNGGA